MVRNGCTWRDLPHDLPPWKTVYTQFWRWRRDGTWEALNAALVRAAGQAEGRAAQPLAGVIDSQSGKTRAGGEARGVDVYKQISGGKRRLVLDTLGLLLLVVVHSGGIPDSTGVKQTWQALFERIKKNSEAMVYIASIRPQTKRLAAQQLVEDTRLGQLE